jgi:hypothetical protein
MRTNHGVWVFQEFVFREKMPFTRSIDTRPSGVKGTFTGYRDVRPDDYDTNPFLGVDV